MLESCQRNERGEVMKKSFFGGIHPADKKDLTCNEESIQTIEPDYVVIPLRQHIGGACYPLVKVGDYVYCGQKIGDGEGMCVPVHSSVSGNIKEIKNMPHPNGGEELAIIIKNDKQNLWEIDSAFMSMPEKLGVKELFQLIREAGIAGMGGAAFPTERKILAGMEKAEIMLINGCECEPYITADDMVMRNWPEKVVGGIEILQSALKSKRVVLAIEDNKKRAIGMIEDCLSEKKDIELKILPTRYPQGAEKQLIQAVTGKEIPPGKLPIDIGCVVFNVSTVWSVFRAVKEKKPFVERVVTVTGEGVVHPGNYMVPIGTTFGDLIQKAGGLKEETDRVIAGGPMMGKAQETLDVPVIKGVGAILCLPAESVKKENQSQCIRCGKCVEVCPVRLQPLYLYRYGRMGNSHMIQNYHLIDCIECGSCSYICPAKLPLTEQFRKDKKSLRGEKK